MSDTKSRSDGAGGRNGGRKAPRAKAPTAPPAPTKRELRQAARADWQAKVDGMKKRAGPGRGERNNKYWRGEKSSTSTRVVRGKLKHVVDVSLQPQRNDGIVSKDGVCKWRCVFEYNPVPGKTMGETKLKWLVEYAKTRSVVRASLAAGVQRSVPLGWRESDKQFDKAFLDIRETVIDWLEDSAMMRATYGYLEPVFQQARLVGHKRVHHPGLTMWMLQKNRKDKYGDAPPVVSSPEDLAAAVRAAILVARDLNADAPPGGPPASVVAAAGLRRTRREEIGEDDA